jgi:hypothetical protein
VNEDWLDILLRGRYEVSLPNLTVSSSQIGALNGSGQIGWNPEEGIRIQAVTNGRDIFMSSLGRDICPPGHLIPHSTFHTFSGQTQDGWELTADKVSPGGNRIHSNNPSVVWDRKTPGITLLKDRTAGEGRSLRILMGPPPPQWVRMTKTEVHNSVFGTGSSRRDWLTTTCKIGVISARERSDEWFEVMVLPNENEPIRPTNEVCTAVARAFGFIFGRRFVIRGHEDINENGKTRRLDTQFTETTTNTLLLPLGTYLEFMVNGERLLGLAIDFFLTELGQRVAHYLYLCWDTADNSHVTRLTTSSICLEGLMREAAKSMGPTKPHVDHADLNAFRTWRSSQPDGLSQQFLNRLNGLVSSFSSLTAKDIFRDWINRQVLEVTKDDLNSWDKIRNPSAHGQMAASGSRDELQTRVSHHTRIQNLQNKIVLQLMGYTGTFVDYAQPGFAAAVFPFFSSHSEVTAEETSPVSPSKLKVEAEQPSPS